MSALNGTAYEGPATRTVRCGPGTTLEQLVAVAARHRVYGAWGGCPTVTLGGYVSGGGEGFAAPMLGMGLDAVTRFVVVTATGAVAAADAGENADLYWALRGGGGPGPNFGMIVEISAALSPPPPVVTTVLVTAPAHATVAFSELYFEQLATWPDEVLLWIVFVEFHRRLSCSSCLYCLPCVLWLLLSCRLFLVFELFVDLLRVR